MNRKTLLAGLGTLIVLVGVGLAVILATGGGSGDANPRASERTAASAEAEQATLAFLAQHVPPGKSPMCGNSICQDRRFLARLMPALERFFHYRNLDVSTVKELARRWAPDIVKGYTKDSAHTALSDARDSIAELRFYRTFMGRLGGSSTT